MGLKMKILLYIIYCVHLLWLRWVDTQLQVCRAHFKERLLTFVAFVRALFPDLRKFVFVLLTLFSFSPFILQNLYCWAVEAAKSVTTKITNSDTTVLEAKVCATALRFMLQVLDWEFSNSSSHEKQHRHSLIGHCKIF